MKFRVSILIVVLMMTFLHVTVALRSTGRDCSGTFFGSIWNFEGKSDTDIIERFEWTDTHTQNPRIVSVGYEDATIWGKVEAYQKTWGYGTVGVMPSGSVSGPDFSMPLPEEFDIHGVGGIIGDADTTRMKTKESKDAEEPGTYTLTGSAEIMAVTGGGGIKWQGTGLSGSGTIAFQITETAEPQTHTLSVKPKYPKSYECAHDNCEVALPDKQHHRVICQEDRWLTGTNRRTTCRREYYRCQTTTCPLDGMHAAFFCLWRPRK